MMRIEEIEEYKDAKNKVLLESIFNHADDYHINKKCRCATNLKFKVICIHLLNDIKKKFPELDKIILFSSHYVEEDLINLLNGVDEE